MSVNAKSEVQRWRYLGGRKGLLEVMSLEVLAKSVGTVTGLTLIPEVIGAEFLCRLHSWFGV